MASSPCIGLSLRLRPSIFSFSHVCYQNCLQYSTRAKPNDAGVVDPLEKKEIPTWAKPLSCQPTKLQARPKKEPNWKGQLDTYFELTKPRLTALVVLSAMSSYALAPQGGSLVSLTFLTIGTALCSGSANAINQGREPEFDRQMTRTRKRPVASRRLTSQQAFYFAGITGVSGVTVLAAGTNPIVAALGLCNIALYGGTYTTLKRKSIINTWVGAVVGAIPPLMGWATCSSLADPGAWILAGLLYSWQFPHFMSLSYSIADEYKNAGYIMSGWTNPLLTARVALRHSLVMFPLCYGAWYFGLTDPYFLIDSSIVNGWQVYAAFKFWQQQRALRHMNPEIYKRSGEHKKYARLLFWASVIHLPLILLLAMMHKKGRWSWLTSKNEEEEEEEKVRDSNESENHHITS